jgi:hypothetical protein
LSGRARADVLFAADGEHGNAATDLYTLDPATGAKVATIGPIGFAVSSLSVNPITGVLYGDSAPRSNSPRQLITINPFTGAGTLVGPLGVTVDSIAFDHDGTLYGWSGRISGSSLYTINTATGAATKVGTSGITDTGAGMAIDPSGRLFLTSGGASGPLRTVDKSTGAVTTVATLSGAPIGTGAMKSLSFDRSGTLFGVNLAEGGPGNPGAPGASFLVTINTTTGAVTSLGASIPGLDAIAFQLTVPEPSPLALVVSGGTIGLAAWCLLRRDCGAA